MKHFTLILSLIFFCNGLISQEKSNDKKVIGYAYNLYAVKAQKLEKSKPYGKCKIPGGLLLDPRKSYSSSFDKDEYFSDDAKVIKENEVMQLPGYFRMSKIYKPDIKNYYISTKMANQWTNHDYEEIIAYENERVGEDIGCQNCNFFKHYFNDEENCVVTVYYQILPLRDKEELDFQESITGQNVGLEQKEMVSDSKKIEKKKHTKVGINENRLTQHCKSCDRLQSAALNITVRNNNTALKKDQMWLKYYECSIDCYETSNIKNPSYFQRLEKARMRHEKNITIRKKRFS